MRSHLIAALYLISNVCADLVNVPDLGLKIEKGFSVSLYADSVLAPDVYSMTLDSEGSVVISSRGYIKRLIDENGDGKAERGEIITKSSSGAMGMLFVDGKTLLTSEGGKFNRYSDDNGDGIFERGPEVIGKFGGGEHGIHAIRKDNKGRIYLIGGNDAKFSGHTDLKQYKELEGGGIIRYEPDLKRPTLISHGFRNPYDFDFNSEGHIYTYDSDCEREVFLPWYSPTRLYRAEDGAHHGWRLPGWKRGWKRPDYYYDSVKPIVNVGRGSPTGVMVYRHTAFPEHYHDAVFYCDWTFGKIYVTSTSTRSVASEYPVADIFLESSGTNGFAPSDIELAEDGSIFVAVGGRGTTGSVYKISRINSPKSSYRIPLKSVGYKGFSKSGAKSGQGFSFDESMIVARHLDRTLIESSLDERMKIMRQLMKALGDWNLSDPSCETLTGYEISYDEIFNEENNDLLVLSRNSCRTLLHSLNSEERKEAARMTAMLKDPHPISLGLIADFLTTSSKPEDDFHYLACISCLPINIDKRILENIAEAILRLDSKIKGKQVRSKQNYIDRLNEVIRGISKNGNIYDQIIKSPSFLRLNHVGIANAFPQAYRELAAQKFIKFVRNNINSQWRADLIDLLSCLDFDVTSSLFRKLAGNPSLMKSCVFELSKKPNDKDRALFVAGLGSPDKDLQVTCARALDAIGPKREANELLALFRVSDSKISLTLIEKLADRNFENKVGAMKWLGSNYPVIAKSISSDQINADIDWENIFSQVDWSKGNQSKGRVIFSERACQSCHLSANALGPDLSGVAKRLSPKDLFHSIANPNTDVPPSYRATIFTLKNGVKHIGRIAFYSADGVIIRTALGKTIRLDEEDIASQKDWSNSIMPEGLLIGLSSTQLSDLYAYIKTL